MHFLCSHDWSQVGMMSRRQDAGGLDRKGYHQHPPLESSPLALQKADAPHDHQHFRLLNLSCTVLSAANYYLLLPISAEYVTVFDSPLPVAVTSTLLFTVSAVAAVGG